MHERLLASVPKGTNLARQESCTFADFAGKMVILFRGIGHWLDRCRRCAPAAHFVVQDDRILFLATTQSSDAIHVEIDVPEFHQSGIRSANGMQEQNEKPALVPIADEDAQVTYYANWFKSGREATQKQLDRLGAILKAKAAKQRSSVSF